MTVLPATQCGAAHESNRACGPPVVELSGGRQSWVKIHIAPPAPEGGQSPHRGGPHLSSRVSTPSSNGALVPQASPKQGHHAANLPGTP